MLDRQLLVGKYHFEEEAIAVDVSLNADSTAVHNVGGSLGIRTSIWYPGVIWDTHPGMKR
jgi:hypothetical protein